MVFEDLFIWKSARILVNEIYKLMYNCKDYGFRDQLQRATISIMNNIAEGCNSGSNSKYIYFLRIARGSCAEVNSMLYWERINFTSSCLHIKYGNTTQRNAII